MPPKREGGTGNLQLRRSCVNLVDLNIKGQRITSLFVCRIFTQNIASASHGVDCVRIRSVEPWLKHRPLGFKAMAARLS